MMSSGRGYSLRAASVSRSMKASMPFTSACDSRCATGASRQARSSFASVFDAPPCSAFSASAKVTSLSVASGRRFKSTSSTRSSKSFGISSYTPSMPALTMAMSMPARTPWNRNAVWMASRTGLLPRKAKDTLDTPPDTFAYGKVCLMIRVASKKSTA
jgi:hypothetical protein